MDGQILRIQSIYVDKTNQSLFRYEFPKEFSFSVNRKHYSNEKQSMKLTEEITFLYLNKERQKMNRHNQVVLVIFDVFRSQITDDVLKLFKQNHINTVFVPANTTGRFTRLNSITGIWNSS